VEDNFDYKNGLYNILDAIPVSVYWKNVEGKYLGCNKYMTELVGLLRSDIIGKTDNELLWKEDAEELQRIDNLVIKNKAKYEAEEITLTTSRQKRIYLSTKTPLYNTEGKVIGIIGISIDITDRKRAEELHVKHEASQKATNFANAMAGSIAHELKNPLASISMSIDRIMENLISDKAAKSKVAVYKKELTSVKKIISDVVYVINGMLAKIKAYASGKLPTTTLKESSITEDIQDVLSSYPFKGNEQELVELKKFNSSSAFKYLGDSTLTKHVFSNLLKNSLLAIRETNKDCKITIELKKSSGNKFNHALFKDNATGIPKEDLPALFNNFESKTISHGGTGLGLSFCKMVMQSYGGDITCDSVEGEYTEFTLKFPRID
jgi:two-component system aerobic respiration control sensor histidine kinase ArcB